jgi:hypothetical protein
MGVLRRGNLLGMSGSRNAQFHPGLSGSYGQAKSAREAKTHPRRKLKFSGSRQGRRRNRNHKDRDCSIRQDKALTNTTHRSHR